MRFGLLSRVNASILPHVLAAVRSRGLKDVVVILDSKLMSQKDLGIWRQRTGGALASEMSLAAGDAAWPVYFVDDHNGDANLKLVEKLGIACLANVGTPRKLTQAVLNAVPHGVVNVHPGVLPDYRGSSCVEWAIYNDDKVGNTAHFMTAEYDAGPVIDAEAYEFSRIADYQAIRVKTYRAGFDLMANALARVEREQLKPSDAAPQPAGGQLWGPIPEDKFAEVLRKVSERRYKHMTL